MKRNPEVGQHALSQAVVVAGVGQGGSAPDRAVQTYLSSRRGSAIEAG